MKKILYTLGSLATIAAPIVTVVSCDIDESDKSSTITPETKKPKIVTNVKLTYDFTNNTLSIFTKYEPSNKTISINSKKIDLSLMAPTLFTPKIALEFIRQYAKAKDKNKESISKEQINNLTEKDLTIISRDKELKIYIKDVGTISITGLSNQKKDLTFIGLILGSTKWLDIYQTWMHENDKNMNTEWKSLFKVYKVTDPTIQEKIKDFARNNKVDFIKREMSSKEKSGFNVLNLYINNKILGPILADMATSTGGSKESAKLAPGKYYLAYCLGHIAGIFNKTDRIKPANDGNDSWNSAPFSMSTQWKTQDKFKKFLKPEAIKKLIALHDIMFGKGE